MAGKHAHRSSASLAISEMQIKIKSGFCFTLVRMAALRKHLTVNVGKAEYKQEHLHTWGEI